MNRWFILLLGVAIAVGTAFVIVRERAGGPPLDEVDDASRARLERVLREAEQDER